ncbi:uncharacterized protein A1O5_07267 [Cladophialophora psammophila CBS 110553]|uniref:DUF7580 domain-containing protein n=1 Tax=Cladophialophora psammophila CBS 110553 TaxID=1182543 RepID=W9WX44_9EURO|nr:uncharacterized protein A1O5_07267 [Cladophialophora psammophila CBS 110553]EXJ69231.1 hypothetical protein A1O5_07267 [Cladophialophora psammophila CBS 110553]
MSDAFQTGRLSDKMKVILAYIIARSAWEFYDSDWMSRSWTAEDIHFMQELACDNDDVEPLIFINRPYLAVRREDASIIESETSSVIGQIHRYPRILALGMMLIEIGTGRRARSLFSNYHENLNSDWHSARQFLSKTVPWDGFDYRAFWDATRNCVNNKLFLKGPIARIGGHTLVDIEARRRIIFEDVVTPLGDLLSGTGWIHDICTVGSMKPPWIR